MHNFIRATKRVLADICTFVSMYISCFAVLPAKQHQQQLAPRRGMKRGRTEQNIVYKIGATTHSTEGASEMELRFYERKRATPAHDAIRGDVVRDEWFSRLQYEKAKRNLTLYMLWQSAMWKIEMNLHKIAQYKPRAPHFIHQMNRLRALPVDFSLVAMLGNCFFTLLQLVHMHTPMEIYPFHSIQSILMPRAYNLCAMEQKSVHMIIVAVVGCRWYRVYALHVDVVAVAVHTHTHTRTHVHTHARTGAYTDTVACWSWCVATSL